MVPAGRQIGLSISDTLVLAWLAWPGMAWHGMTDGMAGMAWLVWHVMAWHD